MVGFCSSPPMALNSNTTASTTECNVNLEIHSIDPELYITNNYLFKITEESCYKDHFANQEKERPVMAGLSHITHNRQQQDSYSPHAYYDAPAFRHWEL